MINKLDIPISGLIENMSWFKPDQSDKNIIYLEKMVEKIYLLNILLTYWLSCR